MLWIQKTFFIGHEMDTKLDENSRLRRLHLWLFSAHPDVTDPVQRRIASLMAMFHFASIPLAPVSLFITSITNPNHVPMDWTWVTVVIICAFINYWLSRSQWYKRAGRPVAFARGGAAAEAWLATEQALPQARWIPG